MGGSAHLFGEINQLFDDFARFSAGLGRKALLPAIRLAPPQGEDNLVLPYDMPRRALAATRQTTMATIDASMPKIPPER